MEQTQKPVKLQFILRLLHTPSDHLRDVSRVFAVFRALRRAITVM
jgi:hypothetical protein